MKVFLLTGLILVLSIIMIGCFSRETLEPETWFTINLESVSPTSVKFSWALHNFEIDDYTVTKSDKDSTYYSYAYSGYEGSIIDNEITPGVTYYFELNGLEYYDQGGSFIRSINTLQSPSGLKVIVSNGESIKLTWQNNNNIQDYNIIERKEESEPYFTVIDSLDGDSIVYFDFDLEHKKKYYYRINSAVEDYKTDYTNIDSTGFHFEGLFVPTDYLTIQEAIDTASPAEKVILEPGIYDGGIVFPAKKITLCSRYALDLNPSHIDNTIIDGSNNPIGITFSEFSYHTDLGKVQGITFQNFTESAIKCFENRGPVMTNLIIKDNSTTLGAMYFENCTNSDITNLLMYNNSSTGNGSVMNLSNGAVYFRNCTIINNHNNPIYCTNDSRLGVKNSIMYNNNGLEIIAEYPIWWLHIYYSDIELGVNSIQNGGPEESVWSNTITEDPLFVDPENHDYHLQPGSPCIDAGEYMDYNFYYHLDADGTRNDMGAYGGPNSDW